MAEELPRALYDYETNALKENTWANRYLVSNSPAAITYHKSLDFSNVGTYALPYGPYPFNPENAETAMAFRQFHQTRIYIKGKTSNVNGQSGNTDTGTFQGLYQHGEVKDTSSTYVISANLPDLIEYSIGSMWEAPLSGMGGPLAGMLVGLLKSGLKVDWLPSSMFNRFQTLQVWNGSKPLNMAITIPVIDDGSFDGSYSGKQNGQNTNFAEALEFLGSLCLPNKVARTNLDKNNIGDSFGFYTPPPSPFNISAYWLANDEDGKQIGKKAQFLNANYARIAIQIGGVLFIDNCIVTGIDVRYTNTKSLIRHHYSRDQHDKENELDYLTPMTAELTIHFSTIEALTASDYSKMLWLKTQSDMGTGEINTRRIQKKGPEILDKAKEMATNIANTVTDGIKTLTGGTK